MIGLAALTLGELENTAGGWFLSVELAPPHLRGRYQGLFKTSIALEQAIGPLVVTAALVHWGRMGWIALAVTLAAAALASRRLGAHALSLSIEKGNVIDDSAEAKPEPVVETMARSTDPELASRRNVCQGSITAPSIRRESPMGA